MPLYTAGGAVTQNITVTSPAYGDTTLAVPCTDVATEITVADAVPAPLRGEPTNQIIVDDEIMEITAGADTTTWTVTRGIEGTTAAAHAGGATVTHVLTAASLTLLSHGVYDVTAYGATGDGTTDDVAAIQAAIDAAGAAGGGVVYFPPGRYKLTATSGGGLPRHLTVNVSGVTLAGAGAASVLVSSIAAAIVQLGGADLTASSAYALTGSYAMQVESMTLATPAEAANFAPGDHVFIRTGQTIAAATTQPDSEINRVVSADPDTGVIVLAWPTVKPYAQEWFVAGTSGVTTTTPTANAAIYGIANVNAVVITDFEMRDLRIEHAAAFHSVVGNGVVRVAFRNLSGEFGGAFQSFGQYRYAQVAGCRFHHTGAGAVWYTLTTATGVSDVQWIDNVLTGEKVVQLHIREGAANILVRGNLLLTGSSAGDENQIAVGPRGYNITITDNILAGTNGGVAVAIDGTTGGGILAGNTILSAGPNSIYTDDPDWVIVNNRTPNAPAVSAIPSTGAPVGYLSAWVKAGTQTATLGTLPSVPIYVLPATIQVWEAFNSDGGDTISIGSDAEANVFGTSTDVSTTGIKAVGEGSWAGIGWDDASHRVVKAFYANGGSEPTTGKALVLLPYIRVPSRYV